MLEDMFGRPEKQRVVNMKGFAGKRQQAEQGKHNQGQGFAQTKNALILLLLIVGGVAARSQPHCVTLSDSFMDAHQEIRQTLRVAEGNGASIFDNSVGDNKVQEARQEGRDLVAQQANRRSLDSSPETGSSLGMKNIIRYAALRRGVPDLEPGKTESAARLPDPGNSDRPRPSPRPAPAPSTPC